MILLISYDLKSKSRNYNDLYDVIKSANIWWHHLESTWLIYTEEENPIQAWKDRIRQCVDEKDMFIIFDITDSEYTGWLPNRAWNWIRIQREREIERREREKRERETGDRS